ncbi:MAG TPA: hypothetical protein VLX44_09695 [Xanthobacteraceae bacterium]|nr:hypothetical protein [Xanthobacteraceae bacterium]
MVSGAGPDAASFGWRELRLLVRSLVRLVVWSGLFIGGLAAFFAVAPYAGAALRRVSRGERLEMFAALVVMAFALLTIISASRWKGPGRASWIAVGLFVVTLGAAAIYWLPGWSGVVTAAAYAALILVPAITGRRAQHQLAAGHLRQAALSMRLASWFHPSAAMRFYADFFAAQALGPVDAKVAAYRALARDATPEQIRMLDQWSAIARDDWPSVLAQACGAHPTPMLEVRALGELGRIDEMIAAYTKSRSRLDRPSLLYGRLCVLAFSGRSDSVQRLLRQRSLAADRRAYWTAIAARAAGSGDTEPRRALARFVETSEDETFRRAAARHLAAPARGTAVALSPASTATIARVESALIRPARRRS